ncbi:LlaJI family restriction endonuclease [Corynebacterium parakroppenstedtii]|uniref:LlaJI family restriction endonuclease n=1 Tax=Corynebacterium parakroppenstedtii TaxID=2828363 RepID=UPI0030ED0FF4
MHRRITVTEIVEHFSDKDLCDRFKCTPSELDPLFRLLLQSGLLKPIPCKGKQTVIGSIPSRGAGDPSEVSGPGQKHRFQFVGVIAHGDYVIRVLPKYVKSTDEVTRKRHMQLALRVLRKFHNRKYEVPLFNENGKGRKSTGIISISLFILSDYLSNGPYLSVIDRLGTEYGEIDWHRTLEGHHPFIAQGVPVYFDAVRRQRSRDNDSFLRRLHLAIVQKASDMLCDLGLLEVFGLPRVRGISPVLEQMPEITDLLAAISA